MAKVVSKTYNELKEVKYSKKTASNDKLWVQQTVEKVQHMLGFLSYMWYNVYGDKNVGRKEKF